ncbi:MAG: DNA repair protein RecO [Deltaproteobacteria bacterium]|nr:DNA repair protein RecO [Deltaproteobacteria bacterium]
MEGSLAIVLKIIPRGEDDLLCDFLTEKKGRLWAFARSARKSRKRFGSILAPLNILDLDLKEKPDSSISFLREATLVIPLYHLQEELTRLNVAFYLLDAIRGMTPERSPEPQKFHLLRESLQKLNQGTEPNALQREFERGLLKLSGVEPHITGCLRCGVREEKGYFVYREGALFCRRCLPAGQPFEIIARGEEEGIFTRFLEYCIGKSLKSKRFI